MIKRRGIWTGIGRPQTKSGAIQFGQKIARETLARSFRVKPLSFGIAGKDTGYKPREEFYRPYKIRKGKRIPLKDEFIQTRRSNLLGSAGERREIKAARASSLAINTRKTSKKKRRVW